MTWEFASAVITKLLSGTAQQRAEAVLYLNFTDYTELKKMCPKSMIGQDTICGVEVKPTFKCPAGKYYLIRKELAKNAQTAKETNVTEQL